MVADSSCANPVTANLTRWSTHNTTLLRLFLHEKLFSTDAKMLQKTRNATMSMDESNIKPCELQTGMSHVAISIQS